MNRGRMGWVVLLLMAVSVYAAPLLAWSDEIENPHYIYPEPAEVTPSSGPTPGSQVVAYDDLPPSAKAVFDASLDGTSPPMEPARDEDVIQVFWQYEYVEKHGQLYRVDHEHADGWGTSASTGYLWIGGTMLLAAAAYQYLQAERRIDDGS